MLIAKDYTPYPEGVYRSGDAAHSHMPAGLIGIFMAILTGERGSRGGVQAWSSGGGKSLDAGRMNRQTDQSLASSILKLPNSA
jgi:hypothetical protein